MLYKAWNREELLGSPEHSKALESTIPLNPSSRNTNLPMRTPLKFFASSSTTRPDTLADTQKAWTAEYLSELRSYRPPKPTGSRPLLSRNTVPTYQDVPIRASSIISRPLEQETEPIRGLPRRLGTISHQRTASDIPNSDLGLSKRGRPLIQQPRQSSTANDPPIMSRSSMITPSAVYRENGLRWMEKQEARSLREALEDMDMRDEERLHAAAQDEASELVWRHQNSDAANKDFDVPYKYRPYLKLESHNCDQSTSLNGSIGLANKSKDTADEPESDAGLRNISENTLVDNCKISTRGDQSSMTKNHVLWDSSAKKHPMNIGFPIPSSTLSARRRSSGSRSKKSTGGLFRNPEDQIYEEPEEINGKAIDTPLDSPPAPLQIRGRNSVSNVHTNGQRYDLADTPRFSGGQSRLQSEIHKNPPSQSRNPSYLRNAPPSGQVGFSDPLEKPTNLDHSKPEPGLERRSDNIRAATSMRMKDRSPKLPSPTVVSDRPGRPIVSFDKNWRPREEGLEQESSSYHPPNGENINTLPVAHPSRPCLSDSGSSAPAIPVINIFEPQSLQDDEKTMSSIGNPPIVSVNSELPYISVGEPSASRALPITNSQPISRPLPHISNNRSLTAPVHSSSSHWSPSLSHHRVTAQCAACALPIAGRIVSASGQRFHPRCFTCHHCATPLEHVAFYPEPDGFRSARLARISIRNDNLDAPNDIIDGKTALEDGDDGLRFYCHLDFHEAFSPRCRNCKTPIEGEVVVACGGEWHVGHFFCAECGDPFDARTPFVEKDGYAWCVGCHARRFSGKCKGCRRPIVDLVVKALGGEWHEKCFCCKVSRLYFPLISAEAHEEELY